MITTLLFDFYGVFQPDPYAQWLTDNKLQRAGTYEEIACRLDKGTLTQQQFLTELSVASGTTVVFDDFYKEDNFNHELISYVQQLKVRYQIGLLSNASPSLRTKLTRHQLDDLFDTIAISGEIGFAKPHEQAYFTALAQLNATPAQTLFIDDNSSQTAAAAALGLSTVTFTDTAALRIDLQQLSIV